MFGDSWPALHGAITHFPVALLIVAAFFDICSALFKKPKLREASLNILALAVIACIPTILTGRIGAHTLYNGGAEPSSVTTHELFAYITSGVAAVLLIWRLAAKDKMAGGVLGANIILSLAVAALVGYTGHLGGQLVFGSTDTSTPPVIASTPGVDPATMALIKTGAGDYAQNGCTSCHAIGGVGGHTGPDLTHEGARQPDIKWQIAHLKNPQSVRPNSSMPPYSTLSDSQLTALATYLLSNK